MKIGIHQRRGSYSKQWIEYCNENSVKYKIVDCYRSDIIEQLQDCDALLWHHHHNCYRDLLFAKQLLFALEKSGKMVFPNFTTGWHFNDKIGQKYLFESINAPSIPTFVFYDKKSALDWAKSTTFPKVFKLRSGASSSHVKLVKTQHNAIKTINKAFGPGFSQFDRIDHFKEKIRKVRMGKDSVCGVFKGFCRLFIPTELARMHGREKGYVYFQDFILDNDTDTRIIVVGDKSIGIRRGVRKGDFRASGSGIVFPNVNFIDKRCVKIAFHLANQLNLQIGIFDFIHDKYNNPLIIEVSYGTDPDYTECEGYWDENLNFFPDKIHLPKIIMEYFLSQLTEKLQNKQTP